MRIILTIVHTGTNEVKVLSELIIRSKTCMGAKNAWGHTKHGGK